MDVLAIPCCSWHYGPFLVLFDCIPRRALHIEIRRLCVLQPQGVDWEGLANTCMELELAQCRPGLLRGLVPWFRRVDIDFSR